MLYAAVVFALAFLSGSHAQLDTCTGEAIQIQYENCGRVGPINVYWTSIGEITNILFEAPDNAWTAFGFTPSNRALGSMNSANIIFGCSNFTGLGLAPGPYDVLLPAAGVTRNATTVSQGFNANNLADQAQLTTMSVNGICGTRFVRPNVLAANITGQNLVLGQETGIVWARGAIGGQEIPGAHSGADRGFAMQDFLGENPTGDLTDSLAGGDPDSGSLASVSSVLSAVVIVLTVSLW